jgi:acetolactate decarboxylase
MTTLYNANTRSAYQAGYYTGSFTMASILAHGNTGLGALDENDGELVIDAGVAWRTAEDGTTHRLGPEETSPFATVIDWHTDARFEFGEPLGKDDFEAALAARLPLANRTWGLRIYGVFAAVTAGASARQRPPYRPLANVMADYARPTWRNVAGTLIAFHCPVYLSGIDYVGGHYHWLSDDHRHGGHVFDFTTAAVTIEACEADSYATRLPATEAFYDLDLAPFHHAG